MTYLSIHQENTPKSEQETMQATEFLANTVVDPTVTEDSLKEALVERLGATHVEVTDISGKDARYKEKGNRK